ncbi:ABC transporter permease [Fimbriiglobus ruber]|uniref:Transport permease protein n=1 Tax=Fimbriiglobus ruber TaxID=1908690 RepID=A0A225DDF5_9BACT|nr:ABC transporter permease [Fimbriiglobus ruber]OWK34435.1 ABC-type multidrug transport system, permease component [Fimbriiglobus ruber]
MNAALRQLILTRFREFFRRPGAVFWVYGFPLMLAAILGFAFQNRPVERIPVDVSIEGAGGEAAATAIKAKLERDSRVAVTTGTDRECRDRLRSAKTGLVVVPAAGPGHYEYVLDPNRPESVLARAAADSALVRADAPGLATPTEVAFDEPGGRYIDFLIPGLVGANLMGGGLWGVGFVVVDMRVRKLLKRFLATPMRQRDFLFALMLSRAVFTLIEVAILLLFGWLAFGVGVRGNPLTLAVLVVLGAGCFGGIGLLVACRVETIESVSGLMNAVMLPMYLLGGVFFSANQFPAEIQPFIRVLPLTALLDGMRAVMNEGAGWAAAARPALVLTAWGVASFAIALRFFRWR